MTGPSRRAVLSALGTALWPMLAGCSFVRKITDPSWTPSKGPNDMGPVPDDQLFDAVGRLPGVRDAMCHFDPPIPEDMGSYQVRLTLSDATDALPVMEDAGRILWHAGRVSVRLAVTAYRMGDTRSGVRLPQETTSDYLAAWGPRQGRIPDDILTTLRPPGSPATTLTPPASRQASPTAS